MRMWRTKREEEEEEEELDDDPDAMDENEYITKVINKGGQLKKFQAGHRKFYPMQAGH